MSDSLSKVRLLDVSTVISEAGVGESNSITVHATVSTTGVARGDRAIIESWDVRDYQRNPVVLFSHDPKQVIGRASNLRMTPDGLEADITFMDEATSATAHMYGKMVRGRWMNAFSVGFSVVSERLPNDAERARGARAVWNGSLLEISLVAVPSDAKALVSGRAMTFTKREVALAKSQFEMIDGWAPLLRSMESAVEPVLAPVVAATTTVTLSGTRRVDHALIVEARDLLTRLQELVGELDQQESVPRSETTAEVREVAPEPPALEIPVEDVRSQDASASSIDWDALRMMIEKNYR